MLLRTVPNARRGLEKKFYLSKRKCETIVALHILQRIFQYGLPAISLPWRWRCWGRLPRRLRARGGDGLGLGRRYLRRRGGNRPPLPCATHGMDRSRQQREVTIGGVLVRKLALAYLRTGWGGDPWRRRRRREIEEDEEVRRRGVRLEWEEIEGGRRMDWIGIGMLPWGKWGRWGSCRWERGFEIF